VTTTFQQKCFLCDGFLFIIIMGGVTYYGLGWIKTVAGGPPSTLSGCCFCGLPAAAQVCLQGAGAGHQHRDQRTAALGPTAQAGYYFLLPIVVLMWCLVVERLVAGAVRLLGHGAADFHRSDPAAPERFFPQDAKGR
jgi:hypothetical protein